MAHQEHDEGDRTWVDVQKKTFTRWANQFLAERMLKIEDLAEDLKDGIKLCELLEVISSKRIPAINKSPKMRFNMLENTGKALNFIKEEGLTLVGIGPEDIVDGKLKLDLGLMWTIILRYHINVMGKGSPKWELLQWVKQQIEPYNIPIKGDNLKNFTSDWQDGTVLSALVDSLKPGVLVQDRNMSGLSRDPLKDTQRAMDTAEKEYEIPQVLDAIDLVKNPDELATMTYVSYFRDFMSDDARRRRADAERRRVTANPSECYAFGPGVEKGETFQENVFTIQTVNCNGDKLETGGVEFDVAVTGPTSAAARVKDNNDGTYTGSYLVEKPGEYQVAIRVTGQKGLDGLPTGHSGWGGHIKNSPYHVGIAGPSAGHSYATGPGVTGARAKQPAPFTIHSVGANGQPKQTGGDPFRARVSGPENIGDVPLKDNRNGTFDGTYTVAKPGRYTVDISLDGAPIKGSPYHLLVENANAGKSYAEGPGLQGGQQGKEGVFTIHSVDAEGKPVREGGDPFEVNVTGPEGAVKPNIKDNNDGTYTVKYTPTGHGDYTVDVGLHGDKIKDAPFHIRIKPAPNAGHSYAEGPGLTEAWDNEPAYFTIHSVDNEGKPRTEGGDPFSVKINGPGGAVEPKVKDNGDGTYAVEYAVPKPGDYVINVDLEGKPIKNSPFRVGAKAGTDASHSGFGIFSFTIQSRDKRGDPKTFGGDAFDVKIAGPGAEVEVQTMDNNDGTYTAVYALAGDHIKGKTFTVTAQLNGKVVGKFNQAM